MFGKNFVGILEKDNINVDHVTFTDKAPTSVASILVFEDGKFVEDMKKILIVHKMK